MHILCRLAFVSALFQLLGFSTLDLYRGVSCDGPIFKPKNRTFVSTTFDKDIAIAHFDSATGDASRTLYRRAVPIERVFMTYYETEAMNQNYLEAEAVLLFEEGKYL